MQKRLLAIVLLVALIIPLAGCGSVELFVPLPVIDCAKVIEAFPEQLRDPNFAPPAVPSTVYMFWDNSKSMQGFANAGSLLDTMSVAISDLSQNEDSYSAYLLRSISGDSVSTDATEFSKLVMRSGTYPSDSEKDGDDSPLTTSMREFIAKADSLNDKQLFVFVSDLSTTENLNSDMPLSSLAEALGPFVLDPEKNVTVVHLQSEYKGNLYNQPKDVSEDGQLTSNARITVDKKFLKGSNGIASVYVILFGSADMVSEYTSKIRDLEKRYGDKCDIFELATAPQIKDTNLPRAVSIEEVSSGIILGENMIPFTLPLPEDKDAPTNPYAKAMSHIYDVQTFTAPDSEAAATSQPVDVKWYNRLITGDLPFYRLYSDRVENELSLSFEIKLPQSGSGLEIARDALKVTAIVADYDNRESALGLNDDEEPNTAYSTSISAATSLSESSYFSNFEINPQELTLSLKMSASTLLPNAPVLFLFEIPMTKTLELETFEWPELRDLEAKWKARDLNLMAYGTRGEEGAYRMATVNNKLVWLHFGAIQYPEPMGGTPNYHFYNKTLGFADFMSRLTKMRAQSLQDMTAPQYEIVQYVLVGFVLRDGYYTYVTGTPKKDDNGWFAFSENEIDIIEIGPTDVPDEQSMDLDE